MCSFLFLVLGIIIAAVAWLAWGWVAGVIVIAVLCAPFVFTALRIKSEGRFMSGGRRATSSGGGRGGLFRYSDNRLNARKRWLAVQDTPVAEWKRCPACETEFDSESFIADYLVGCESCERLYTDPGYVPEWDAADGPTGEAVKDAGRTQEETEHADVARPWISFRAVGESSGRTGLVLMLDHELVYGTAVAFDD